jgi:DNA-binding NarL/FixJ family response regulator
MIEDNVAFRKIFREFLCERYASLEIEEAGDLAEGLRKFRALAPSLVFLDLCLPDGNGLELAERIRQEAPETVVALCTMRDTPEYKATAAKLGICHFLVKDRLDWDEISELISRDQRILKE